VSASDCSTNSTSRKNQVVTSGSNTRFFSRLSDCNAVINFFISRFFSNPETPRAAIDALLIFPFFLNFSISYNERRGSSSPHRTIIDTPTTWTTSKTLTESLWVKREGALAPRSPPPRPLTPFPPPCGGWIGTRQKCFIMANPCFENSRDTKIKLGRLLAPPKKVM